MLGCEEQVLPLRELPGGHLTPSVEEVLALMTLDLGRQVRDMEAADRREMVHRNKGSRSSSASSLPTAINGTQSGSNQFVDEFLSFSDRLRSLESWQDELPKTSKKFSTYGLGISGVKARSASSKNILPVPVADVHSRQPTWVAQSRTSSAKGTEIFSRRGSSASSARRGSSASSDGIPAKLQNLFQVSNKAPRDIPAVRAESDLLAFQTYAPNWKPKQKVRKLKKMPQSPKEQDHSMKIDYGAQIPTEAAELWERSMMVRDTEENSAELFLSSSSRPPSTAIGLSMSPSSRPGKAPKELSKEERDLFKTLPRPKSAIDGVEIYSKERTKKVKHLSKTHGRPKSAMEYDGVQMSGGGARPFTAQSRSGTSNFIQRGNDPSGVSMEGFAYESEDCGKSLQTEINSGSRLGEEERGRTGRSEKAIWFDPRLKLKPKLVGLEQSSKGSVAGSRDLPTCQDCFHAFGGFCVNHLPTVWKASLKQTIIDEVDNRIKKSLSGECQEMLRVKVFTSSQQEKRGKEVLFAISPEETLDSLKARICAEDGTPKLFQRFVFRGHHLDDDSLSMKDCGITNSSVLFVVLQPPSSTSGEFSAPSGCEYCAMALGGICTRHLRDKCRNIYPRHWREIFEKDTALSRHTRATPISVLAKMMEQVDEHILRRGPVITTAGPCTAGYPKELQLFRIEMAKRFNNVFDAWVYFDMDGDGSITLKEFVGLCRPLKFSKYLGPNFFEHVFLEIDAKESLRQLWPFTFVRQVIWHQTSVDINMKSRIYHSIDEHHVNKNNIWHLAHDRSNLPTPIFEGLNDKLEENSPASPKSEKKATGSNTSKHFVPRCPQCFNAVNGVCHKCIPVWKNGVPMKPSNTEDNYYEALRISAEAKHAVLYAPPTTSVFFVLDGVECCKGCVVSVMFENDKWHAGVLDAYNPKTYRCRIIFKDPRIGVVHASIKALHIKVGDIENDSLQQTHVQEQQLDDSRRGDESSSARTLEELGPYALTPTSEPKIEQDKCGHSDEISHEVERALSCEAEHEGGVGCVQGL